MIKTTKQIEVYQTTDGTQFESRRDASVYELCRFLDVAMSRWDDQDDVAESIVNNPAEWIEAIKRATEIKEDHGPKRP